MRETGTVFCWGIRGPRMWSVRGIFTGNLAACMWGNDNKYPDNGDLLCTMSRQILKQQRSTLPYDFSTFMQFLGILCNVGFGTLPKTDLPMTTTRTANSKQRDYHKVYEEIQKKSVCDFQDVNTVAIFNYFIRWTDTKTVHRRTWST